jgi:hypothetical protein
LVVLVVRGLQAVLAVAASLMRVVVEAVLTQVRLAQEVQVEVVLAA